MISDQQPRCSAVPGTRFDLGEGLIWDHHRQRLLMTDIVNCKLIELDIENNHLRSWQLPENLAWVMLTDRADTYLLGLRSGIALFSLVEAQLQWLDQTFPGQTNCRLNDAQIAPNSTLWFGSMNDHNPDAQEGKLASYTLGQGLHIHDSGFGVSNGPVISPDGRTLFCSDTLKAVIYRYELNPEGTRVNNKSAWAQFRNGEGFPDGMCFDQKGKLWVALWGAAKIIQLADNGTPCREIAIPAPNVTNLCFAGKQLDRLFVTTARVEMSPTDRLKYPLAGSVFEVVGHHATGFDSHTFCTARS